MEVLFSASFVTARHVLVSLSCAKVGERARATFERTAAGAKEADGSVSCSKGTTLRASEEHAWAGTVRASRAGGAACTAGNRAEREWA
jgi:hypothetical protein